MADDRAGIRVVQFHAGGSERGGRRLPGLVNPCAGQPRQLRNPAADVIALGVELLALADRVKDAEVGRGVGAAAGGPLPTEGVIGEVGIDQRVPKPTGAFLPGKE